MKKIIYENEADFEKIMQLCDIDMDMSTWERFDYRIGYEHARPLISKRTGQYFGALVFEQSYNDDTCEICEETYIVLE